MAPYRLARTLVLVALAFCSFEGLLRAQAVFIRGDSDSNGSADISDALRTLGFLFMGGPPPECLDACDADDSGTLNITDPMYTLGFLFLGGPRFPAPHPDCGLDPTEDRLPCESYGSGFCARIESIAPPEGETTGGTPVTVFGRGFTANCAVFFGDRAAARVSVVSAELLIATTPPAEEPRTVDVTLRCRSFEETLPGAFRYVAPGTNTASGPDQDGDGLSDAQEADGWIIWVDPFGLGLGVDTFGNVTDETRYHVSSDPASPDTDSDGLGDLGEFLAKCDPRKVDTDGDGLWDSEERQRWGTSPISVDTDADSRGVLGRVPPSPSLFDGLELFAPEILALHPSDPLRVVKARATSPSLADTDGDNRTDSEELGVPGRSGVLGDLPELRIEPAGDIDIRLNLQYAEAEGESVQRGTTLSQSVTESRGVSETHKVGFSTQVAFSERASGGITGGVETSMTITLGLSYEFTYTSTRQTARTATRESSEIKTESFQRTETFSTGSLRAGVRLRNTSNIAYRVTNLSVLATQLDQDLSLEGGLRGVPFRPLATLVPSALQLTLAPGELSPVIALSATEVNGDAIKAILERPSLLGFETASFDLETQEGINFDFIREVSNRRTATLVLDFDDGTRARHYVATNVRRNPDGSLAGITLGEALRGILGLPEGDAERGFTVAPLVPGDPHLVFESILGRRARFDAQGVLRDRWLVAVSSPDRHLGRDVTDIVLQAGDEVSLYFVRDSDNDGVADVIEAALSDDETAFNSSDTDGDGLTDREEILIGWIAFEDPENPFLPGQIPPEGTTNSQGFAYRRVTSDPNSIDPDEDGLPDFAEFQARSDPHDPDTDKDGLLDGKDPLPAHQGRLVCVHPTLGSGNPGACFTPDANGQTRPYNPECAWENAVHTLQEALELYRAGAGTPDLRDDVVEIWVAQGVYRPDQTAANPNGEGNRNLAFELGKNLGIFGGFSGPAGPRDRPGFFPGETKRGQRDPNPITNGTVLSGDILENDLAIGYDANLGQERREVDVDLAEEGVAARRTDNSQRVVLVRSEVDSSAVLDGFQIYGAYSVPPQGGTLPAQFLGIEAPGGDPEGGGLEGDGGGAGDPNTTGADCPGQVITGTGDFGFQLDDSSSIAMPPGSPCPRPGKDRFFLWTSERTDGVRLDTCNRAPGLDTVVVVYDVTGRAGFCNESTLNSQGVFLGCNDDADCGTSARLVFNAVQGNTYLLRIGVFPNTANSGDRGLFNLDYLTAPPPPPCPTSGNLGSTGSDCSDSAELVQGTGDFRFVLDSSANIDDPPGCPIANDKYFRWQACDNGTFTIDTCEGRAPGLDTVLSVHDITGRSSFCNAATLHAQGVFVACSGNSECGSDARVTFSATRDRLYLIRIGIFPGTPGGSGRFRIAMGAPPPPPCLTTGNTNTQGRDCTDRGELIQGIGVFGFALDDSASRPAPPDASCPQLERDRYLRWIACQSGRVTVDTCGLVNDLDTVIAVYDITGNTNPCADLNAPGVYVACNDDADCCEAARVTFPASVGREYLIRIGVVAGTPTPTGSGLVRLYFGEPVQPEQGCTPGAGGGDCTDGVEIQGSGEFAFETDGGSSRPPPPDGQCPAPGKDRYFVWTAERTDTVTIDTCGLAGGLDTVIALYDVTSGLDCSNLNATYITCSDDAPECGVASRLTFSATVGGRYLIRVGVFPDTPGGRGLFRITYAGGPVERLGDGAGLHCFGSPRLGNLLFIGNVSLSGGAGALVEGGSPTFRNVIFAENWANFGAGALVSPGGDMPLRFENCTFERNRALRVGDDDASKAVPRGGGLLVAGRSGSVEIDACAFVGNFANNRGAGLYSDDAGGTLAVGVRRSRFTGNEVPPDGGQPSGGTNAVGGGVFAASRMSLTSSLFFDNRARRYGGGIFVLSKQVSIVNCTVALNRVSTDERDIGAGILSSGAGALTRVENSILWMNVRPSDEPDPGAEPDVEREEPPEKRQLWSDNGGFLSVRSSDFNRPDRYRGNGNIGADPMFSSLETGGLDIARESPCIDRGNSFVDTEPLVPGAQLLHETLDVGGNPRVMDGNGDGVESVDMGAFEMPEEE